MCLRKSREGEEKESGSHDVLMRQKVKEVDSRRLSIQVERGDERELVPKGGCKSEEGVERRKGRRDAIVRRLVLEGERGRCGAEELSCRAVGMRKKGE